MYDVLLVFVFVFTIIYWLIATRHPKGFPPGPRYSNSCNNDLIIKSRISIAKLARYRYITIPIAGDALALKGSDAFEGLSMITKKYGSVVGLWLGPSRTVVINDFDLVPDLKMCTRKNLLKEI